VAGYVTRYPVWQRRKLDADPVLGALLTPPLGTGVNPPELTRVDAAGHLKQLGIRFVITDIAHMSVARAFGLSETFVGDGVAIYRVF